MAATKIPAAPTLAAIDMGSNSFRLEVAQVRGSRYSRLGYIKESVRLGSGLDAEGMLTPAAIERGLDTLRRFAEFLKPHEVAQVRAVATQTLREARNRNAFLALAEEALGLPIEVISGREEARLIYAGVAFEHPTDRPRMVVDIGGRSTEFVIGHGDVPGPAESFGIGSQSSTLRHFPDGRLTAEAFRAAQVAAGAEFEEAGKVFTPDRWHSVMASSGTAGAVSQLLATHGLTDGRITREALAWCIERCIEAGHIHALRLRGLKEDRKPVLAGGLSILYTLMMQFGIYEVMPANAGLRQGVIVDLHQRRRALHHSEPVDVRDATVAELQKRFEVDVAQARRVRGVALDLQRCLVPGLDSEEHRELGWACDLHEIGMMVSHHDHHRHSAYLLSHLDAAGFSQSQQRRVADLVLAQRGGLRKVESAFARPHFALQVLCLRVAVLVCHARQELKRSAIEAMLDRSGGVQLSWRRGRALPTPDPRTLYLLREEVATWSRFGALRVAFAE